MDIFLNGETHSLHEAHDLSSLVAHLKLGNKAIAVAVNRQVIPRAQWQQHILVADDQVDIVRAIGGG